MGGDGVEGKVLRVPLVVVPQKGKDEVGEEEVDN